MDNTQLYTEILQRNKKMLSDSTRLGTVRKAKAAGELIQMRPALRVSTVFHIFQSLELSTFLCTQ